MNTRRRPSATESDDEDVFGELVDTFARPIRDEVAIRLDRGPDDVRFHRLLTELLQDCDAQLTPHIARRAAAELKGEVASWLARQRDGDAVRSAEMALLVTRMASALDRGQGADADFFEDMDAGLAQLRTMSDGDTRGITERLATAVGELTARLHRQREAAEERAGELAGMVKALREELRVAKAHAKEDPLTGLLNRGAFDERLQDALARAAAEDHCFCLVLVDLDHFKSVNDTHGHVAGDRVLKVAADVLSKGVPESLGVVARYGGEEFGLILHVGAREGTKVAERLRVTLEQKFIPARGEMIIQTASFGVAQGARSDTADSIIHRADQCLYAAKRGGRNQVVTAGLGDPGSTIEVPEDIPTEPPGGGRGKPKSAGRAALLTALRTRRSGPR